MSYTLKTQQIAVKDPETGTYSGVDILTEQTKSGLLAEIQAEGAAQRTSVTNTGATQVSAVQAKGAETLASIPPDYTTLSNDVDDLKNTFNNNSIKSAINKGDIYKVLTMADFEQGAANQNGLTQSSSRIRPKTMLHLDKGDKLYIEVPTNFQSCIAVFDMEGTLIVNPPAWLDNGDSYTANIECKAVPMVRRSSNNELTPNDVNAPTYIIRNTIDNISYEINGSEIAKVIADSMENGSYSNAGLTTGTVARVRLPNFVKLYAGQTVSCDYTTDVQCLIGVFDKDYNLIIDPSSFTAGTHNEYTATDICYTVPLFKRANNNQINPYDFPIKVTIINKAEALSDFCGTWRIETDYTNASQVICRKYNAYKGDYIVYPVDVGDYSSVLINALYPDNTTQNFVTYYPNYQIKPTIVHLENNATQLRVIANFSGTKTGHAVVLISKIGSISTMLESKAIVKPINLLVIGDSYSQNQDRWINQLKQMIPIKSLVNLACSGSSLKDKYVDRTTYPYDGRPVGDDTRVGNYTTFDNQLAKLDRLMTGTDLDEGETQLYTDSSQYPDVVIIAGGKNDRPDSNGDYTDQMIEVINNVYIQYNTGEPVTLGNITLPVDYEETDRTTFGGAMHYQYGFIKNKFPNTRVFFITPSGINYGNADIPKYITVADQMRSAAQWLCTPTVDWDKVGRVSYVDNVVSGSGTQADPYIYRHESQYTADSLHPNYAGGYLLAEAIYEKLNGFLLH